MEADKQRGVWTLMPQLQRLRQQFGALARRDLERTQFRVIQRRIEAMRDEARARALGTGAAGVAIPFATSVYDPDFINQIRALGVPVSVSDEDAWTAYVLENDAERYVEFDRRIDEAMERRARFVAYDPLYDLTAIDRRIARMTRARDAIQTIPGSHPDVVTRAGEIAALRDAIPPARVAKRILEDPRIKPWADIVFRILDAGLTPRAAADLDPELNSAAEVAENSFRHSFRRYQSDIHDEDVDNRPALDGKLAELRKRLIELGASEGRTEVALRSIARTLAGDIGHSGSIDSRANEQALRDMEGAIVRLAIQMGASAPDATIRELREAIITGVVPPAIRTAFGAAGISPDILTRIILTSARSPEFRNAVIEIFDRADPAQREALITRIEQIERHIASGDTAAAARVAGQAFTQQNQELRSTREDIRGAEQDLEQTLDDSNVLHELTNIAGTAVPDPSDMREMVSEAKDAIVLAPYTRADGTPQPAVRIMPGEEYTDALLGQLQEWVDNAWPASNSPLNDAPTRLGLTEGIPLAQNLVHDRFTPTQQLNKTFGPTFATRWLNSSFLRIRDMLKNTVPGVWGQNLYTTAFNYVRATSQIDALRKRSEPLRLRLMQAAFKAYGLNPSVRADHDRLNEAYNEVAHRLRQHGSLRTVAVGDTLYRRGVSGLQIEPALLALLRFDRGVFKEAQAISQRYPYGGIREERGGIRYVRPAASTGDIGLARIPNADQIEALAKAYRAPEGSADPRRVNDDPKVLQYWNDNPDAITGHIRDTGRTDLGTDRQPDIADAERRLKSHIESGGSEPTTLDAYIAALASYMTRPDAAAVARAALLQELSEYGKMAMGVDPAPSTSKPATGAGKYTGEKDLTEFTQPAAPIRFPSTFYEYGASGGLRPALERVLDPLQVAYLQAVQFGRDHLLSMADQIRVANRNRTMPNAGAVAAAQWITGSKSVTPEMLERARLLMGTHATNLDKVLTQLAGEAFQTPGVMSSINALSIPYYLSWLSPMVSNIVGGPISGFATMSAQLGPARAAFLTSYYYLMSALHGVVAAPINLLPARLQRLFTNANSKEITGFIDSLGLGHSYGPGEVVDMHEYLKNPVARAIYYPGKVLTETVSPKVGVRAGDTILNRFAMRFFIPDYIKRIRRVAQHWQARLNREGLTYDPRNPATGLSAADAGSQSNAATLLEVLGGLGFQPEMFLAHLANVSNADIARHWRHPDLRPLTEHLLGEFNVANRLNRPPPNSLLALLGWAANTTTRLLEGFRQVPNASAASKITRRSTQALATLAVSAAGYYAQMIARQAVRGAQTKTAELAGEAIAKLLGNPPDEDDENWASWVNELLQRLVFAFQSSVNPKLTPIDRAFWDRPPAEVLLDVVKAAASGTGLGNIFDGNAVSTPALQTAKQWAMSAYDFGRAGYNYATGDKSAASRDVNTGLRNLAGLFGEYGRVIYNAYAPGQERHKKVTSAIQREMIDAKMNVQPPGVVARAQAIVKPTEVIGPLVVAGMEANSTNPQIRARGEAKILAIRDSEWEQSFQDAMRRGGVTEEQAASSADAGIQRTVASLQPFERAAGRNLSPEESEVLQARILANRSPAQRAAIQRELAAHEAVARVISENPREGRPAMNVTEAMMSPVRSQTGGAGRPTRSSRSGPGMGGGGRGATIGGGAGIIDTGRGGGGGGGGSASIIGGGAGLISTGGGLGYRGKRSRVGRPRRLGGLRRTRRSKLKAPRLRKPRRTRSLRPGRRRRRRLVAA